MRTSGGAGASLRRLHDATPGALHPLTSLLLTLLLLCSLVAASETVPPQREWPVESHVTVGADGLAASRGAGRRRSDGLSITRSITVETGNSADSAVDDQAIKFTPTRVDLGRAETCSPQRFYVGIENRGRVSVRLDGADFTHEGFSLANDVRGIRLDPGDRFNVEFVFLPREVEPNGVDAHLRVLTTSGLFALPISSPEVTLNRYGVRTIRASIPAGVRFEQSLQFINPLDYTVRITEMYALDSVVHLELFNGSEWIGPRWPRESDNEEVVEEVHGEYNQEFDYARRANRGAWDMPPGTTNPLVKVSLLTDTPGEYFTYIHIAAGERRLLLVPVRITVLKPGIHVEPKEMDLGVLTDFYEDEPLELYFSLYNTGLNPIEVLELKVLESNMIVSAQLRGSTVIPPQTRVYHALAVQLRVNRELAGGDCIASLLLKSNASSPELGQRKLRLYGKVVKGHLAFQLSETLMEVITPLDNVFNDDVSVQDVKKVKGREQSEEDQAISLVSIGQNGLMGIMTGTSEFRKLRLWNLFDRPVELQRIWVQSPETEQDGPHEVTVYRFKQRVVPAGAAWPKISLQITPAQHDKGDFLASREYSLMVETNATLHRIQIHVYHSILSVNSSRGLHNYSVSGYSNSISKKQGPPQACSLVPKDGVVSTMTPRIDGEGSIDTQAVQICRSLLFDLEKLASHRARTEVVTVRNENPVPLVLTIANTPQNERVQISIRVEVPAGDLVGSLIASVSNSTNLTSVVSVGDIFVLDPGNQVIFFVEVQPNDTLGEITVPVLSLSTPVEMVHLYARLLSVQGTIEPVTPTIVLPSMFPGRTEIIRLMYRNTFEHPVTPLLATTSSSTLKILSMGDAMAPQQVGNVLDLLFSPAADSKCSDAMFLADCLLPLPPNLDEQTCEQLSDYGESVDAHDLAALSRRNAFWSETRGSVNHSTVEAEVQLQTDIMDDVANVTIMALLERALVTVAPAVSVHSNNASYKDFEHHIFVLTEVLHLNQIFVHVQNPSNISIQMELAIAAADQGLFYSCDHELRTREGLQNYELDDEENNNDEDIPALCLAEWRAIAADAVTLLRDTRVDVAVPPFYFQRKIVQVPAGEATRLGPIWYLPSKVQEVTTTMFVRNDLSHIEPVPLLARSGKGTLNVLVDAPADNSESIKAHFAANEFAGIAEQDDSTINRNDETILTFALTEDDAAADYSQSTKISLSNTGPFGLTIHSVAIERDDVSWKSNDFLLTPEPIRHIIGVSEHGKGKYGVMVLPPGKTAHFRVSFCANCFAASVASWLVIDTSDSVKRIRLVGMITTDAAFACLHSRMSLPLRFAFHIVWMLAVGAAAISMLYALLVLAHDAWTSGGMSEAQPLYLVIPSNDLVTESENQDTSAMQESEALPRTFSSIHGVLEQMERAAFSPPAHVVTPVVAALLERRHKGLRSTIRSNSPTGGAQPSNFEIPSRDEGGGKTSSPVMKMEADDNKAVVSEIGADKILHSDAVSTSTEPSSQGVQKAVCKGHSADAFAFPPSANVAQPVSHRNPVKIVDAKDSLERSDSEEDDSESPEDFLSSSSHSTVAPSDAEESSRSADFPKLMFASPGDEGMLPKGSDLPALAGTASQQKEEGPFEAFKSLSERWRAQDWQENTLSRKFPGVEAWDGALSLNTLGLLGSTVGNQRDESADSSRRNESGSFLGAGSGLYLDGFSTFAAPSAPATSAKKAPPGFTPADAKPLETRAAFERLRGGEALSSDPIASTSGDSFGGSSLFASKLPLFGPALPPSRGDHVMLGGVGRIGSGRSKVVRGLDALETSTQDGDNGRRRLNIGQPSHS